MNIPPPPPKRRDRVLDIECYTNFFYVAIRDVLTGSVRDFRVLGEGSLQPADIQAIHDILATSRIFTFNGRNYDAVILTFALLGYNTAHMKRVSDAVIVQNLKPWDVEREFGVSLLEFDHVDLIEVAPGQGSLKIYAGRLHSRRLQDLPIDLSAMVTPEDADKLADYCANSDCVATIDLLNSLRSQLDLRVSMSEQYGIDLRSKSDAQIAEAVIRKEVETLRGGRVYRPELPPGVTFRYTPPAWLSYSTPALRNVLERVTSATFSVAANGSVEMPPQLEDFAVPIGQGVYRMGIGGLHSSEKCQGLVADADHMLIDRDVASYYPAIILNCGLFPSHMGREFLQVYRTIVDRRIAAKRAGDKVVADSLKITINGSFGKLGSKWSALYSPDLMIQVTLTGQLALMMLIESLELAGIRVVSANTDGIIIYAHRNQYDMLMLLIGWWERTTGFETEETRYRAVFSRDVNNYVAIKAKGGAKTKGAYSVGEAALMKNPVNLVCIDAVLAHLEHGVPVEMTVWACEDVRRFVTLRKVQGGGQWGGRYLGKTVRWVYATDGQPITYVTSGNKVARSDGALPVMDLPDTLPATLDRAWYVAEAQAMLKGLGAVL